MNPLISLVIPVYNVEKYLRKCLDSVLAQTYDNFEAILVDDGSTDNSGKICDEYAEKDNRIIVYHKPNGGLSDARNYGVEHANADLVSFIDSDDYVAEDYLEYLWYLMKKYDVDIASVHKLSVSEKSTYVKYSNGKIIENKMNTIDALKKICIEEVSACARIYNKEILIKNKYPVDRLFEDLATTYKLIGNCEKVAFSNKIIYFYVQHDNSIKNSKMSERKFDIFKSADEQLKYMENNFPEVISAAHTRCACTCMELLSNTEILHDKKCLPYFIKIRNYLKKHIKYLIMDSNAKWHWKLSCLSIIMGYYPAKFVFKSKNKIRKIIKGI